MSSRRTSFTEAEETIGDALRAIEEFSRTLQDLSDAGDQVRSHLEEPEIVSDLFSSSMADFLEALEQRIAEAAQLTGGADASGTTLQSRDSPAYAGSGTLAVVSLHEFNEAVSQLISALSRIEAVMERATDIQVTVSAGDGWD